MNDGINYQCWRQWTSLSDSIPFLSMQSYILDVMQQQNPNTINSKIIWPISTSHYSKSQFFVQKFNFDKPPTFSRVFHPNFLTIFLVKSKLSTAKKSKTTTFSRVFHPKKSAIFSGNQSWIFGQKMKISNSVPPKICSGFVSCFLKIFPCFSEKKWL